MKSKKYYTTLEEAVTDYFKEMKIVTKILNGNLVAGQKKYINADTQECDEYKIGDGKIGEELI